MAISSARGRCWRRPESAARIAIGDAAASAAAWPATTPLVMRGLRMFLEDRLTRRFDQMLQGADEVRAFLPSGRHRRLRARHYGARNLVSYS